MASLHQLHHANGAMNVAN